MKIFKWLFFTFFFALAAVTLSITVMTSVDVAKANVYVPPSQREGNLSVEEENALLAEVEFSLHGAPSGETALFIDTTMISRLTLGQKIRLPLTGNERCGVNLKVRGTDDEWEHVTSLGCINHTPYASIGFTVDGMSAKVSQGAWR